MEPKLMLGGALLAVGVLVTLLATLRGGPRGALAGAEQGAAATGGPGVVQPLQAGASRPPLPAPLRGPVRADAGPRTLAPEVADTAGDVGVGGLEAAARDAELQARLVELERQNQELRFRLAEAERRLASRAAAEVTDFLAGVRAGLDEGFVPEDFVLAAAGQRVDFRRDVEAVLFDVARHLRTQDLAELRRVADIGRVRQVVAVLDTFHRRRVVDGVEDWTWRKRQIAAIFRLPLYPGT